MGIVQESLKEEDQLPSQHGTQAINIYFSVEFHFVFS